MESLSTEHREAEVLRRARNVFAQWPAPEAWVDAVWGLDGIVSQLEMRNRLSQEALIELLDMRRKLRDQHPRRYKSHKPTRMITVRLSPDLHALLIARSRQRHVSLNSMCVDALCDLVAS